MLNLKNNQENFRFHTKPYLAVFPHYTSHSTKFSADTKYLPFLKNHEYLNG